MPLSKIQRDVLGVLAAQRNPGSSPLIRSASRYSLHVDIFRDRQETVARAALQDVEILSRDGFATG